MRLGLDRSLLRVLMILGVALWTTGGRPCLASSQEPGPLPLVDLLQVLNSVPKGNSLIQKALNTWNLKTLPELARRFKWGEASRTDTVLTRYYNSKTGKEDRERLITIYLKADQDELDAILDAAHELVHAVSEPGYDPYDPTLSAGKYIWAAIEGKGGEVDAVFTECEIGVDLAKVLRVRLPRCQNYLTKASLDEPPTLKSEVDHPPLKGGIDPSPLRVGVNKEQIRKDFYRVGEWRSDLVRLLKKEAALFPQLSSELPMLYSSTGHAPYPVALLKEFEEITQIACKNSRRRLSGLLSASSAVRTHAAKHEDLQSFLQNRCDTQ